MSEAISMFNVRNNSYLFENKRKRIQQLVGDLRIDEVREDGPLKSTIQRIKNMVLLKPVTFQEPKITDNYTTQKTLPPTYENPRGGPRQINVITVRFNFDGSSELFNFVPNGIAFSSSSNNLIYQPDYSNNIDVKIELLTLDKNSTLDAAKAQMELTFSVIEGNNLQAKQFNASVEPSIEQMVADKRKELIDFYS